MSGGSGYSWLDRILEGFAASYLVISIVIGVIISSIYFALGKMIELEFDSGTVITVALMGVIVAFQLIVLRYLLSTKREVFRELNSLFADQENYLRINVEQKPYKSFWYYVFIPIIILPFYLVDWISPDYTLSEYFLEYYSFEPGTWTLLFDFYNNLTGLLVLFLFSNIIWILINMAWTFRDVAIRTHGLEMNANIFEANGRLGAIRDSLLKFAVYYFICVSLIVISYINFSEHIYETAFLVVLLLIGLIFFFVGFEAVNSLMNSQVGLVISKINKKNNEYIEKLLSIASDGEPGPRIQETNFVSNMLEVLQKQRDDLARTKAKAYDLKSIFSIIGAFLLPILTDAAKKNLDIILGSVDIINQGISVMNSLIHK